MLIDTGKAAALVDIVAAIHHTTLTLNKSVDLGSSPCSDLQGLKGLDLSGEHAKLLARKIEGGQAVQVLSMLVGACRIGWAPNWKK